MLNWICRKCSHKNKVAEVTHEDFAKDAKKKFKSFRLRCEK